MKFSKTKQFLIVFTAFLLLGIPFKVMVLVEGFTEVRPVNALLPIAGMLFGPIGALACGVGNAVSDLFGTFNMTSILGFFGNCIGAYIPYRLWHIYSDEQPNLHKNLNILKYVGISFSAALSLSWFLGFGLYYLFGTWYEQIYTYIFYNSFGFSVGLGVPLFIMLTSDDVRIECVPKPKKYIILKNDKWKKIIPVLYTLVMTVMMVSVTIFHISPSDNVAFAVLSLLGLCGIVAICV